MRGSTERLLLEELALKLLLRSLRVLELQPQVRQSMYFCTSKASKLALQLLLRSLRVLELQPQVCQSLYFCTSKAVN
jgi:hypothetical protein